MTNTGELPRFRPLAGITVFRTAELIDQAAALIQVSVPWRGLRSFGLRRWIPHRGTTCLFPSPGGDYGLSDQGYPCILPPWCPEFPSPGGDYGLSDRDVLYWPAPTVSCFRPLAGITVFRTSAARETAEVRDLGFRPLAGITVFRTQKLRETPLAYKC